MMAFLGTSAAELRSEIKLYMERSRETRYALVSRHRGSAFVDVSGWASYLRSLPASPAANQLKHITHEVCPCMRPTPCSYAYTRQSTSVLTCISAADSMKVRDMLVRDLVTHLFLMYRYLTFWRARNLLLQVLCVNAC